jgi:hypothetical protein
MVNVALFIRMEAMPGKEAQVEKLLTGGQLSGLDGCQGASR